MTHEFLFAQDPLVEKETYKLKQLKSIFRWVGYPLVILSAFALANRLENSMPDWPGQLEGLLLLIFIPSFISIQHLVLAYEFDLKLGKVNHPLGLLEQVKFQNILPAKIADLTFERNPRYLFVEKLEDGREPPHELKAITKNLPNPVLPWLIFFLNMVMDTAFIYHIWKGLPLFAIILMVIFPLSGGWVLWKVVRELWEKKTRQRMGASLSVNKRGFVYRDHEFLYEDLEEVGVEIANNDDNAFGNDVSLVFRSKGQARREIDLTAFENNAQPEMLHFMLKYWWRLTHKLT